MSDRKAETGSKSVLEIILEFGHKAVLKDEEVKVAVSTFLFLQITKTINLNIITIPTL